MQVSDWKQGMRVIILGAVGVGSGCIKANTTDKPPFRENNITKAEVRDDAGRLRKVALSRIKDVMNP